MDIHCPKCNKIVGRIADEKIPPNKKGSVTCPLCQTKITVFRKTVDNRGIQAGQPSRKATSPAKPSSSIHKGEASQENSPYQETSSRPSAISMELKPTFTGTAGEYFRIWIVNIFLTIVTFGVYAAWAKVRTRRYFYAHTQLSGHPFDYLANPVAILKGNLVIAGGIIFYNSSQVFSPILSLTSGILFAIIVPFLIYKSLRFYAHNSSYRNIRFRFYGSMKESYITYLLLPLCIPLTFGLIFPYWAYRRKNYFFNNFTFGATKNNFTGESSPFYWTYLKAFLMIIAAGIIVGLVASLGMASFSQIFNDVVPQEPGGFKPGAMFFATIMFIYILFLTLFSGIQQYIYSRLTNYCWSHAKLGKVRFQSTLLARRLLWIRLTNVPAIIFSLGLLIPWAKIRRTRYILDNIKVITASALDDFTASAQEEESALGDATTDFFDFEIAL